MSADATAAPLTEQQHEDLRSLLGAWALGACPRREAAALERHLRHCPDCAEEGARLRDAAGWLSADEPLDPSGALRQQVLDWCLARRPAELPVPAWGAPYAAETAKLDALLRDLGPEEWQEIVELPWHGGTDRLRPAEVLSHLAAVDGYLALSLGLPDPVPAGPGPAAPAAGPGPAAGAAATPARRHRSRPGGPRRGSPGRAPRRSAGSSTAPSGWPPPGPAAPPSPSARCGAGRPAPWSAAPRSRPAATSRSTTASPPCRCGTPSSTGPSSATCTARTWPARSPTRTRRRRRRTCGR
ncbi:zf-HC2 domain-containing protein [Kitasatospora indigofera]|uniref:zf-HC2 domain-containing protein n=1 Tax=Kitasatospora indigofera TaxID=67307 RepID=UPI003657DCEB